MSNIALYREYRPKTFDEVIGQDHIVQTLKNQIKNDSLSHAYLFCGTRGTGKTSTAKIFAKAINCENNIDGSPCLNCRACRELANSSNLDILEIDAASNNRVDEIRDLRDKIKYPPVVGKYKVYIIDEVHMLTDSAYNALLKTLEEPPKHAIFILCTTEVHKLPQTILSRCMRFDFRLVSIEDLKNQLRKIFNDKGIKFEEEAVHLIASRGEGSVRDTLSIADLCASYSNNNVTYASCLEALGSSSTEALVRLSNALISNDGEGLLIELNNFAQSGKNFTILSKELINHLKTLLTIKTVVSAQKFLMLPNDIFQTLSLQAEKVNKEFLLNAMTKLSSIETQLKFSINPRTLLEITLLGLLDEKKTELVEKKTKNLEEEFLSNNNSNEDSYFTDNEENNIKSTENNIKKIEKDKNTIKTNMISEEVCDYKTKIIDDIFTSPKTEVDNSQIIVGKILRKLRTENYRLLFSCYQNLEKVEIVERELCVYFDSENFKEILEKASNLDLINDIIKEDNLKIKYIFNSQKEEKTIEDILKEKFNNIEIKE
ncbi:MAG: DNA polymerase III subunit gamma/tau [Christensenellales bacterium]